MTTDRFKRALALTLVYEGGKVDDPQDPGGRTNQGVTQRVYDAYRRSKGQEPRDVYVMTDPERDAIYRKNYWDASGAGRVPDGLDLMLFDFAVNSGVSRAVRSLQKVLGVTQDGIIGVSTLSAIEARETGDLIVEYSDERMRFLRSLKTFKRYGKGWTRRVEGVRNGQPDELDVGIEDYAWRDWVESIAPYPGDPLPAPSLALDEEPAKAPPSDAKPNNKPAMGALAAAAGATGQSILAAAQQVQPQIGATIFGQLALGGFVVLMVAGGVLLAYSFYRKAKDAGLSLKELFQ